MAAGLRNLLALVLGWKAASRQPAPPYAVAAAAVFVSGAAAGQCWVN